MIAIERTAALLLAAGRSRRFGEDNKLIAPLAGKPLAAHAAQALGHMPLLCRVAVIASTDRDSSLADLLRAELFTLVENPSPDEGQDTSIRLGLHRALEFSPDAVLLCLADMPHISRDHLHALAAAADPDRAAMSSSDSWLSPPALLPAQLIERILSNPRATVRSMLHPRSEVVAPQWMLADVDTASDLARASASAR